MISPYQSQLLTAHKDLILLAGSVRNLNFTLSQMSEEIMDIHIYNAQQDLLKQLDQIRSKPPFVNIFTERALSKIKMKKKILGFSSTEIQQIITSPIVPKSEIIYSTITI